MINMLCKGKIFKNYFFIAFLTFLLSICAFYIFKILLPDKIFTEITAPSNNVAMDSTMNCTGCLPDTVSTKKKDDAQPVHPLRRFFEKLFTLEKTKKGVVRVAYFGDSMIESDLMVYDVRKNYQDKYGGSGLGFAILSYLNKPSGLLRQDYSSQWVTYTFLDAFPPVQIGVSGYVSITKNNAAVWVHFSHRKDSDVTPAPALARAELFYGRSNNNNAKLTVIADRNTSIITDLQTDKILNKQQLTFSTSEEFMLRFNNASGIPFYGINFADEDGVYVDNFPMRSSTGLPLSVFNADLMNAFQQELQYDLIILQYGLNVSPQNSRYAQDMIKVVEHLKECFPGADILVISSPDRAKKYGMEMRTDNTLHELLEKQEEYAENSGTGFINLFQLMGGTGSMVKWVKAGIAKTDYAHFNSKGSKIAADLIFKQMEEYYEEYKKENNLFTENKKEEAE
jgi:hypothetical protein